MAKKEFDELIETISWLKKNNRLDIINSIYERNESVELRRIEFDLIYKWFILEKKLPFEKLSDCFLHELSPEESVARLLSLKKIFSTDRVREYYGGKLKKFVKYYFQIKYEEDLIKLFENHLVSPSEFNLHLIRKNIIKKDLANKIEDKYIRKLFSRKTKKDGIQIESIVKWNKKLTNEEIFKLVQTYSGDELIYISQLIRREKYEVLYRLLK